MKILNKKNLKIIFMIFMILQPIFDIFYLYNDNLIAMFKFSPSTIIRMIIMIFLFATSFLCLKADNKKKVKYFVIFSFIYGLYTVLHHVNGINFYTEYSAFSNYSTLKELFYIIRMMMPLIMVFVTYEKKLEWKDIKKIVISTVLIFSIIMVITNLFEIALTSYNDGSKIIKANFIKWFIDGTYEKYGYSYIASKGIFHMANQVSGTLICLLPIVIYIFLEEKLSAKNIITLSLMILSMLMLGTRIASYGWLAVVIAMIILYTFFCIIKKFDSNKKCLFSLIIITTIFAFIIPYSPVSNRTYLEDNEKEVNQTIKKSKGKSMLSKFNEQIEELENEAKTEEDYQKIHDLKTSFIKKNRRKYGFDDMYLVKLYPYTEDCDFWLGMFKVKFKDRANHRQQKTFITKRAIELNDNKLDYVFGMSFSRMRNAKIYMENDIYVHLYSIGIIGILLFIMPYCVIAIYCFIKMLKNKEKFTFINMVYLFSIALIYLTGLLSGNIFDEWIATLFLAFISGILLTNILNKEKNE